jgi:hypothetical protein
MIKNKDRRGSVKRNGMESIFEKLFTIINRRSILFDHSIDIRNAIKGKIYEVIFRHLTTQ